MARKFLACCLILVAFAAVVHAVPGCFQNVALACDRPDCRED